MSKQSLFSVLLAVSLMAITSCSYLDKQHSRQGHGQDFGLESAVKGDLYHAVLPCASCPGIDTWIQLYKGAEGMRFRMVERYLEEDEAVFINEGSVTQKGKTFIELQRKDGTQSYLVGDGYLSLLGAMEVEEGNIADNADYRLYRMPAELDR